MNSNKRIILLLLLIALIPRAISLATFDFIDSGGGSDSVTYLHLARNLFSGRGFTEFGLPHTIHHPFYPVVIGLLNYLTGDLVRAGLLASALSGVLLVIPVYLMAAGMFGRRTGFLAGLATALFPVLVYGSTECFSESLYTLLLISGIAAGWLAFQSGGIYRPVFSGVFLGLGFLTHPVGIAFLPLAAGFNLLAGRQRHWWKERIRPALLIAAAFSLTCLPFWLYLRSATGNWQISGSSHYQDVGLVYVQARGMEAGEIIFKHMELLFNPDHIEEFQPGHEPLPLSTLILRHPGRLIRVIHFNLVDGYREMVKTAHYLALPPGLLLALLFTGLLLILVYFFISFIRGRSRAAIFYLALMFSPIGIFLIVLIEHRYFFPFIPLAIIALSLCLDDIVKTCQRKPGSRRIFIAGAAVFYLALAAGSGFLIYRKAVKASIPYEYKMMGTWMGEHIPGIEKERVMMFRLGISHYAGCEWNVFYWGDFPGLKDYLTERAINYLVVDSYKLHMLHPELRFLLEADPPPEGFSVVREVAFDGRKTRLLRFQPEGK